MYRKIIISCIIIIITFLSYIFFSKLYYDKQLKNDTINNITKNEIINEKDIIENNIDNAIINKNDTNGNFSIKLSFAGDTMLASNKDQTAPGNFNDYVNKKDSSYFLEKVKPIFEKDDFTILNLENALTDQTLQEIHKSTNPAYWYKSKTSNINILSSSSVEGISVSNNHTGDYGSIGKQDTINAIINANMEYGDYNHIMYFKKNNYTVSIICKGLWIESQTNEIIPLIKEAEKKSDYQIVFFHGGTERIHHPEEWKKRATRKLIDNGADLVIGSHPHVLQPRELYKDKDIVYSLGNFCYGGNRAPENRTIIYQINLTIDKKTNSLIEESSNIIPCYVYTGNTNNYQPAPIDDEYVKKKVIDFMDWKVDNPL